MPNRKLDLCMQLDAELLKKTGAFGLVTGELAAYVGGGFLIGRYLDQKFHTVPWISVIITILGLILAIRRIASWYGKEIDADKLRK